MNYREFKEKQEQELDTFSKGKIYYCLGINKKEVIDKLASHGLKPEDVVSIGLGGYIKKEYVEEYNSLLDKRAIEKHDFILDNVYECVNYELWNYEIEISLSYTYEDVPSKILGLSEEEIEANESEINRAFRDYKKEFYELN